MDWWQYISQVHPNQGLQAFFFRSLFSTLSRLRPRSQTETSHSYGTFSLWKLVKTSVLFAGRITQHISAYVAISSSLLGFEPSDSLPSLNIPWGTTGLYQSFRTYRQSTRSHQQSKIHFLRKNYQKENGFCNRAHNHPSQTPEYSPASLFPAQPQACRGTEYKTCHSAPSFSSFCRDPRSSPASTCPGGSRWGGPTALALAVTRTRFETTPLSRISVRSADAAHKDICKCTEFEKGF